MKRIAIAVLLLVVPTIVYLLTWPVPIDPVAWDAPKDRGLVGSFAENDRLGDAQAIDLGDFDGPEEIAADADDVLYIT